MDRFSKLHPSVQLMFFLFSFVSVIIANNPFVSAISLMSALIYELVSNRKKIISTLKFNLLIVVFIAIFNFIFVHYGNTVLFNINSIKFTFEALLFGVNQGVVVGAFITWFAIFSRVMDSERVVYVLRFAPKLALMFSMVLGAIPRLSKKLDAIREARLGLGNNDDNNKKSMLKNGISDLSALVTYSLEGSIITANSMEARGFNPKKIRVGRFKPTIFDAVLLIVIIILSAVVISQIITNNLSFIFQPVVRIKSFSIVGIICFAVLELLPTIIELVEDVLWKLSNAKA